MNLTNKTLMRNKSNLLLAHRTTGVRGSSETSCSLCLGGLIPISGEHIREKKRESLIFIQSCGSPEPIGVNDSQ